MRTQTQAPVSASPDARKPLDLSDYPVREYIRAMSAELAQMALWDGDPVLAEALEGVVRIASAPVVIEPVRQPQASRKRAS